MKIRYYGHVGQGSGYGRAATDLCAALLRAGVDLEISSPAAAGPDTPLPVANAMRAERDLDPCPDVVVIHTLPQDCAAARARVRTRPVAIDWVNPTVFDTPAVAYTTWESGSFPPHSITDGLGVFNQVWVPSYATEAAFIPGIGTQLEILPHTFDEDTFEDRRAPWADARPDRFRFYYVGAWTARKNPAGLIRAFCHAFSPGDNVELVLRATVTLEDLGRALLETGIPSEERPRISLLSAWRDDAAMRRLHRQLDCFVTASHGEAWNLPAFEAMLAGRHVIAPMGQGSDTFLAETSATLYRSNPGIASIDVRATSTELAGARLDAQGVTAQGLDARSTWQEPDLVQLAVLMRDAYNKRTRDLRIDYDPRERFGYAAVAQLALKHLAEICR